MSLFEVKKRGKVGLMVCGHSEYWPQFPEMKGQFIKNATDFKKLLESQGVDVITFTNKEGDFIIDNTEEGYKAGLEFKAQDIDLLFLYRG